MSPEHRGCLWCRLPAVLEKLTCEDACAAAGGMPSTHAVSLQCWWWWRSTPRSRGPSGHISPLSSSGLQLPLLPAFLLGSDWLLCEISKSPRASESFRLTTSSLSWTGSYPSPSAPLPQARSCQVQANHLSSTPSAPCWASLRLHPTPSAEPEEGLMSACSLPPPSLFL